MSSGEILMFAIQTGVTLIIGLVGWSIKSAINDIKTAVSKNTTDIEKVKKELSDLKSDLPHIYTLREDFIRTLNNVDRQIGDVSAKLDKILYMKGED